MNKEIFETLFPGVLAMDPAAHENIVFDVSFPHKTVKNEEFLVMLLLSAKDLIQLVEFDSASNLFFLGRQ